ncbi:MAG TPA: hypothetical protein VNV36_04080 [Pseudomonas sp.]|uniref:hypothetical protein n=1 Tax=Pseudomonas sp. TaxID=306 RepID=UPI002C3B7A13|nr:hypothetical protein [Pseudomonas sp.]HWH85935.1 hypothetical protein [Pseudomonas sp.]
MALRLWLLGARLSFMGAVNRQTGARLNLYPVEGAPRPCPVRDQSRTLMGIARLIMLGELAVNRVLDNLELPG